MELPQTTPYANPILPLYIRPSVHSKPIYLYFRKSFFTMPLLKISSGFIINDIVMNQTITVVPDHPCHGFNGCPVCREFLFARSREKWQRLQQKWEAIRQRSRQPYQPDAMTVAAILSSPTKKELQGVK